MPQIGPKPTLVLIHGYLGGSLQFAAQSGCFARDFHVICPDLPGFGQNNAVVSPDTIAGFAQHVLAVLDSQGIYGFHLLGHSMGGMVAQEIAACAPGRVHSLILYGTGPVGNIPGRFESMQVSKQRLGELGVEANARRISAKWFVDADESPAYQACADIAVQTSPQAAVAALCAMETWCGRHALVTITSPTLVVWGEHDTSYLWPSPAELCHKIPGARLSVVPGCAHAVHLEKPCVFNAIVLDFLRNQAIPGGQPRPDPAAPPPPWLTSPSPSSL